MSGGEVGEATPDVRAALVALADRGIRPDRFVFEAGAGDGVRDSHSLALIREGWRGCLVEPDPRAYEGLFDRYRYATNVTVRQGALALTTGSADFVRRADWTVGHLAASRHVYPAEDLDTITVQTCRLPDLLAGLDRVGIMILDLEGMDTLVLDDLLASEVPRPQALIVEAPTDVDAAAQRWLAEEAGYELVAQFLPNQVFVWDEVLP